MSLNNLQSDDNNSKGPSVESTVQKLYDVGLFDCLDNKDGIFTDFIILNKRRRRELETDK